MSSVWVQLYYKGEDEPVLVGEPDKIPTSALEDVADLKEAVKDKMAEELTHCSAAKLVVYPPKSLSSGDKNKYKPGKKLSEVMEELMNTTPTTCDEHPLIVVAPDPPQQPQQQADGPDRFRNLLKRAGVAPKEEVMRVVGQHFASNAMFACTPEEAQRVYSEACLLPRSVTQIVLKDKGISVAEVFHGGDPSKAVLLHADRNGCPHILKIATDESISHEYEVWSAVKATNPQSDHYLVPLEKLLFESAEVEIGDMLGSSSVHPKVRCGVLMKHYQGTLSRCKIPLTAEVLLRFGRCLQKAVSTLHQAGYCHMDIKPSNIFRFEEQCYLGDFGAATKPGDPIRERTIKYYPTDGDFYAKEETDFYLLAMTLLELFGEIPMASERNNSLTKKEIHEAIDRIGHSEVREFLASLFGQ